MEGIRVLNKKPRGFDVLLEKMAMTTYKRPRGLDTLIGHLPDWNKLGLCLTAM